MDYIKTMCEMCMKTYTPTMEALARGLEAYEETGEDLEEALEMWTTENKADENIALWTEKVLVVNWKIWEHHEKGNADLARQYDKIWKRLDAKTFEKWTGDDLAYYIRETD